MDAAELNSFVEEVAGDESDHVGLAAWAPAQIGQQRVGVRNEVHRRNSGMAGDGVPTNHASPSYAGT